MRQPSKEIASFPLTGQRAALAQRLSRWNAAEEEAQRHHTTASSRKIVKAVMNGSGLHAFISDGKATIEICDGAIAVSVNEHLNE